MPLCLFFASQLAFALACSAMGVCVCVSVCRLVDANVFSDYLVDRRGSGLADSTSG